MYDNVTIYNCTYHQMTMAEVLDTEACHALYPESCRRSSLQHILGGVKILHSRIIDTPRYLQGKLADTI